MKPAPFDYSAPTSLEAAVEVLGRLGHDAKVLAGGQSLLPLLSMRLAAPAHLVDINRIPGLDTVREVNGQVEIGALARHSQVWRSDIAAARQPLLRQALSLVAHPTIRNRGTTVGSIAHADPAGEMTAVTALLDGVAVAVSVDGEREIAAADFFIGPLETSLREGELLRAVRFRARRAGEGSAFVECARRHGDYALVGVGALVQIDERRLTSARVGFISVSTTPLVLDLSETVRGLDAEQVLADGPDAVKAAGVAVRGLVEPEADIHATADYRRLLADVLTARAIHAATGDALGRPATTSTHFATGREDVA
ncbi:MAG: FAD binding domain-containing protein [Actinomycetes bacterium]